MAGYYPNVPANRFAYHLDGTTVLTKDSTNNLYDVTTSAAGLNDEDGTSSLSVDGRNSLIFLFPELRNLTAYFNAFHTSANSLTAGTLETSTDTTNGLDGTWTTLASPWIKNEGANTSYIVPQYRQQINAAAASLIKALRFNFVDPSGNNYVTALHLYGSIPPTQSPDRLMFWEPVNNNETPGPYFDWGDMPLNTAQTKQFRIKNNSSTLTANSITISAGAATFTMALEFSTDNVSFASSINIGNLAAGTTSSVLYARRTVPSNETLRVQAVRLSAVAASWS